MKEIKLSQGKSALVDDEDYEWLNQWKWYAWLSRGKWYAARCVSLNGKQRFVHLHRLIMNTTDNMIVDHKDNDGLNCQKYNMRNCTHQQNMCNRQPRRKKSSIYLGVWVDKRGYIYSGITVNNMTIHLGTFKTERVAAMAYNEAAIKYHGEFANLNIIE